MQPLVECHSGYAYAERPIAFHWEGNRLEIERILAEWRAPRGKGFRVLTNDSILFDLFYDLDEDEWEISKK